MREQLRVVLDTNVLLRGLVNIRSTAGRVVGSCDRRVVLLLLSKAVLAEYRAILTHPAITDRYPELTGHKVEVALRRFRYVGDLFPTEPPTFDFPRDPKDAKFIELAIAGRATHLVSADNDLLSLTDSGSDAATRFRQRAAGTSILDPAALLDLIAQ